MAADHVLVDVHVRPGSRDDAVGGVHDGALAVRVRARPVDGRANDAVLGALADAFGVPRRSVTLVAGATARRKRVRVEGPAGGLQARLEQLRAGA